VHEATSAGLPVICTQTCGSTPELVQDRVNGYVVDPKDPIALSAAMSKISQSSDRELWQLSKQSYQLSLAYSPQKWVQTFLSAYQNHISHQA
jgi:glycosyltransferase involved in cell wall biosynthesis